MILPAVTVANSVRQQREQWPGAFLIGEGATDCRFFRRLIDTETCHVVNAYNKSTAFAAQEILDSDGFTGAVTVVDADHWRIDGSSTRSTNVLMTDGHDMEILMLLSPALDVLLSELGSEEKLAAFTREYDPDLRRVLLEGAGALGALRLISTRRNLNLRFEDLSFSRFTDRISLKVDLEQAVSVVKQHSQHYGVTDNELVLQIKEIQEASMTLEDLACGHDVMEILSLGLRRSLGTNDTRLVASDDLERGLRMAYSRAFFKETSLWADLRAWEDRNQLFRVLTEE